MVVSLVLFITLLALISFYLLMLLNKLCCSSEIKLLALSIVSHLIFFLLIYSYKCTHIPFDFDFVDIHMNKMKGFVILVKLKTSKKIFMYHKLSILVFCCKALFGT